MTERTYPYTPKNPLKVTPFSQKWGILAHDFAIEEDTTTAAIHMRVMHHGTPFQRKKAPTICEVMTGKTTIELAKELGVTPITISKRIQDFGDPYRESDTATAKATRGTQRAEHHWTETKQAGVVRGTKEGWLSPRHPDYYTWRYKYIQKYCPTGCDDKTGDTDNDSNE